MWEATNLGIVQKSTCTLEIFPIRMFYRHNMFIGLHNLKVYVNITSKNLKVFEIKSEKPVLDIVPPRGVMTNDSLLHI